MQFWLTVMTWMSSGKWARAIFSEPAGLARLACVRRRPAEARTVVVKVRACQLGVPGSLRAAAIPGLQQMASRLAANSAGSSMAKPSFTPDVTGMFPQSQLRRSVRD
jgi:hypothetical protein